MSETHELQALFGGTFDPIHNGHLTVGQKLAAQIGVKEIILLPNNVPPHRPQPEASPEQRLKMVSLAIAGNPLFRLDCREMARQIPSWTIDTLEEIRAEKGPEQPLGFIIGQDSLLSLPHWHRWQELLNYCHLLVCKRPGYANQMETPALQNWLDTHLTRDIAHLHNTPAGTVFLADTPLIEISASDIRQRRHAGLSCADLLPAQVIKWIDSQGLYLS